MTLDVQVLARGLHLLGMALLWGTLVFRVAVEPANAGRWRPWRFGGAAPRLAALERLGALLALAAGLCWLVIEAAAIGDADTLGEALGLVWPVAASTMFGQILTARLALLLLALCLPSGLLKLLAACVALGLQPWLGHAGAGEGPASLAWTEMLHVLAAGAWIGALPALWLSLGEPRRAVAASERFAPLGLACVAILAGSGIVQGLALIGGLAGLLGTAYGHVAMIKIALFAVLLALASLNRFLLTGRVERLGEAGLPALRASLAAETLAGLLVIMAASLLASQAPGAHEPSSWPFAWRPSLAILSDPAGWALLAPSLGLAGAALLLLAIGLVWRRVRWAAVALGLIGLVAAPAGLGPLFVPAWPTSYAVSPSGFSAPSIARGLTLYAANCTACHGALGRGDGALAATLPIPPADLTAPHLFAHRDGELFWWIRHGMVGPDGALAMPGIDLPDDDVWALIDAIRARNGGLAYVAHDVWPVPLAAPDLRAVCRDGTRPALSDWRGQVVRVVGTRDWRSVRPASLPTIAVTAPGEAASSARAEPCVAETEEAWVAYATVSGRQDGFDCLIDASGWLRRCDAPGAVDPGVVAAIEAHPLAAGAAGHHHG